MSGRLIGEVGSSIPPGLEAPVASGAMAYELLSGTAPFHGRPPHAVLTAHLAEQPVPLSDRVPQLPDQGAPDRPRKGLPDREEQFLLEQFVADRKIAGAVAAGVWAAQQPLDMKVFGVKYDDTELLGKAVTRGPLWRPADLQLTPDLSFEPTPGGIAKMQFLDRPFRFEPPGTGRSSGSK